MRIINVSYIWYERIMTMHFIFNHTLYVVNKWPVHKKKQSDVKAGKKNSPERNILRHTQIMLYEKKKSHFTLNVVNKLRYLLHWIIKNAVEKNKIKMWIGEWNCIVIHFMLHRHFVHASAVEKHLMCFLECVCLFVYVFWCFFVPFSNFQWVIHKWIKPITSH